MLDEMLNRFNRTQKQQKTEKIMLDEKAVLYRNLIESKFFIQHFQAHPTQFSCWIGLLLFSFNI